MSGPECDISRDRTWSGQYYCGLHGVWWRCDDEPDLCPAGEAWRDASHQAAEEWTGPLASNEERAVAEMASAATGMEWER